MRRRTALQRLIEESRAYHDTLNGVVRVLRDGDRSAFQDMVTPIQQMNEDDDFVETLQSIIQRDHATRDSSTDRQIKEEFNSPFSSHHQISLPVARHSLPSSPHCPPCVLHTRPLFSPHDTHLSSRQVHPPSSPRISSPRAAHRHTLPFVRLRASHHILQNPLAARHISRDILRCRNGACSLHALLYAHLNWKLSIEKGNREERAWSLTYACPIHARPRHPKPCRRQRLARRIPWLCDCLWAVVVHSILAHNPEAVAHTLLADHTPADCTQLSVDSLCAESRNSADRSAG
jgi:hypothetical protein